MTALVKKAFIVPRRSSVMSMSYLISVATTFRPVGFFKKAVVLFKYALFSDGFEVPWMTHRKDIMVPIAIAKDVRIEIIMALARSSPGFCDP